MYKSAEHCNRKQNTGIKSMIKKLCARPQNTVTKIRTRELKKKKKFSLCQDDIPEIFFDNSNNLLQFQINLIHI